MSIEAMKVEGPLHVVCQCDKCKAEKQEPVIGTKTWFEDGKVITQHLHPSDIYKDVQPKREPLTDLKETLVEAMSIINHYGMHGWSKAAHDEGERVMKNARKALAAHGIKGDA